MEIHELPAHEMLARMDAGELSSTEIVEALHRRADRVEPEVNAFAHQFREKALVRAKAADEARARGERWGALHGLPLTVKENVDTAGVASTLGMKSRQGRPALEDAVTVALASEAGAVILGKTNVPQTLLSPMETTNHIWGTTNNPWNVGRGPGGSSGGEAAALASGSSALGIGTDIGGSIRLPSAFCGVVGLKPTVDRWSNAGSNTAIAGQEVVRSQIGPLAREARDVALLLRALESPLHTPRDPRVSPAPLGDPADVSLEGLRVGMFDDDGFFPPAASVRRAVGEAAETLVARGAEVVPFRAEDAEEITYLYFAALSSDGGTTLARSLAGEPVIDPLKTLWSTQRMPSAARKAAATALGVMGEQRLSKLLGNVGRKAVDVLWALTQRRADLRVAELRRWNRDGVDAVICPPHVTPAAPHGYSHDFTMGFCYAARWNLLDFPAGVVPVTRVRPGETHGRARGDRLDRRAAEIEARSAGLPLAVQVVARPWQEHVALAVMQAVQDGARQGDRFPATPVDPVRRG